MVRISRAASLPPDPDPKRGTILDDDVVGRGEEDDPDFNADSYDDDSSDSDDTYYDSGGESEEEDDSGDDDDDDSGKNLHLDEKIHEGKTKGTRTDGGAASKEGTKINFDDYPGVPQRAVTGPVVAAVFSTAAICLLGVVNQLIRFSNIFFLKYLIDFRCCTYVTNVVVGRGCTVEVPVGAIAIGAGEIGSRPWRDSALKQY